MFNKLKTAYGAGYRAGRVEPEQISVTKPDGREVSYLVPPTCPFPKRSLRSFLWHEGYYEGQLERLTIRKLAHG